MRRREFLKHGASTLVFLGLGPHAAQGATLRIDLFITDVEVELIDGERVVMRCFASLAHGPRVPGPVIRTIEGDTVEIAVRNGLAEPHAFAIPDVTAAATGPIPPGGIRIARFTAPVGGTYLYLDPIDAPVNRLLGLHGALVVLPRLGTTAQGSPTPYSRSRQTPALATLFDALGRGRFPGEEWRPELAQRERVWVFNQIDPRFNAMAERGIPIAPQSFVRDFTPRYFTLNGRSGFEAAHDKDTVPVGREGEPILIRVLNGGLAEHSPHIHGNHIFELSETAADGSVRVRDNIIERDTWTMPALARKDVLLPFTKPIDIPAGAWPPRDEPFPLRYPMHCHNELSQTAAGGNYPQGLVTDWELDGPLAV